VCLSLSENAINMKMRRPNAGPHKASVRPDVVIKTHLMTNTHKHDAACLKVLCRFWSISLKSLPPRTIPHFTIRAYISHPDTSEARQPYSVLHWRLQADLMPNAHRRRRRDETVLSRRCRRCEHNSQLAHDDCRRIRSTIWKLTKQTP